MIRRDYRPQIIRIVKDDRLRQPKWSAREWTYRLSAIAFGSMMLGGSFLVAWALSRILITRR